MTKNQKQQQKKTNRWWWLQRQTTGENREDNGAKLPYQDTKKPQIMKVHPNIKIKIKQESMTKEKKAWLIKKAQRMAQKEVQQNKVFLISLLSS